jgi:hypothetical protein
MSYTSSPLNSWMKTGAVSLDLFAVYSSGAQQEGNVRLGPSRLEGRRPDEQTFEHQNLSVILLLFIDTSPALHTV